MNQWALNINNNSHQAPCIWSEEEITMFELHCFVLHMHVKANQRCSWHKNKGSSIIDCFLAGCFPNDYVGLVVKFEAFSLLERLREREQKNKTKTTFLSVFLQCEDALKLERGMEYKSLSNVQRKTIKVKLSYLIAFECPLWLDLKVSEITCTLKIAPVPKINIQLE